MRKFYEKNKFENFIFFSVFVTTTFFHETTSEKRGIRIDRENISTHSWTKKIEKNRTNDVVLWYWKRSAKICFYYNEYGFDSSSPVGTAAK